jgi:Na+/melibiose symporter-like transporter
MAAARVESGTSGCDKFMFSMVWFTPFIGVLTLGYQQGAYSAVYEKVDTLKIGLAGAILILWTIVNDIVLGYLQDKEFLNGLFGWFNKDTWGRRAPWVAVHIPILCAVIFMSWAPPQTLSPCLSSIECVTGKMCMAQADDQTVYGFNNATLDFSAGICPSSVVCYCAFERELIIVNSTTLDIVTGSLAQALTPQKEFSLMQLNAMQLDEDLLLGWYILCQIIGMWAWSAVFMSGSTATAELYPFKEERSTAEAFAVLSAYLGVLVVITSIVANQAVPSNNQRVACGLFGCVIGFLGYLCIPVMRRARQPTDKEMIGPLIAKHDWSWRSIAMCCCGGKPTPSGERPSPGQLLQVASNDDFRKKLSHTFCDGLHENVQLVFLAYYFKYVAKLDGENLTDVQVGLFIGLIPLLGSIAQIGATAVLACYWNAHDTDPRGPAITSHLIMAVVGLVVFATSDSIWGFLLYFVVYKLMYSACGLWKQLSINWVIDDDSHALFGRRREGLFHSCNNMARYAALFFAQLALAASAAFGLDTTGKTSMENQDKSGVFYLRAMYMIVIPALNFLSAFLVWRFPIHGEKLRQLGIKQAETFKAVDLSPASAHAGQQQVEIVAHSDIVATIETKTA